MDFKNLTSLLLQGETKARSIRELHLENKTRDFYHDMQAKRQAEGTKEDQFDISLQE